MNKLRQEKGITLIALVITIIVLLILAGITLSTLAGRRGIIKQAQSAETEHNKAVAQEEILIVTMQSLDNRGNMDTSKLETGLNDIGATIKSKRTAKWKVAYKGYGFEIKLEEGAVTEISNDELEDTTDERLITKWNVAAGEEIRIVVYEEHDDYEATNVNFTIDWGDGTIEEKKVDNITKLGYYDGDPYSCGYITHTYQTAGTKTIIIDGECECFGVDSKAITSVENWGETGLKRIDFSHCSNLVTIASPSANSFTNIDDWGLYATFWSCESLVSIPSNLFDSCPNAQFEQTFGYCTSLTGDPIALWGDYWVNTSETKGGGQCYTGCTGLNGYTSIPEYWRDTGSEE